MSVARFRVFGSNMFNGKSEATVEVERESGIVKVRPLRMHKAYELRLADIAKHIIYVNVMAEIREKKALKKMKRKGL